MKKVAKVLSLIVVAIFMIMLVGCDNDMAKTNTTTDIQDLEFEIKMEDLGFSEETDHFGIVGNYLIPSETQNPMGLEFLDYEYATIVENIEEEKYSLDTISYANQIITLNYCEKESQEYKRIEIKELDYWLLYSPIKLETMIENLNGIHCNTINLKTNLNSEYNEYYTRTRGNGTLYETPYFNVYILDEVSVMERIGSIIFSKNYTIEIDKA